MRSLFNQIIAASWAAILSLPARLGASAVAVFGTACVVGVFIGVLSMAAGLEQTLLAAGSDNTFIVMRDGATSEMNSGLDNEQAQLLADLPGAQRDADGRAIAAAELFVIVDIAMRSTGTPANVPLRGVQQHSFTVRDKLRIVEGRNFQEGQNELIVGRAAQSQFVGLNVGDSIKFGQSEWRIVGAFEDGGSVSESEIWCDVRILQQAYRRGNSFQTLRVKLNDPAAVQEYRKALASDLRLKSLAMKTEKEYYSMQSESVTKFIKQIGYPLAILMAIGAIFGALNTMYASVSARTREIATLRALGFGSLSVICSTMLESLLLALMGGLIGSAVVYFVFNGYTVSTMNGETFSQVVFAFAVTPELLIWGVIAVAVIGVVGGFFPALRAAWMPVVVALRES